LAITGLFFHIELLELSTEVAVTRHLRGIVWSALLAWGTVSVAVAAPPSDKLLPAGTLGYASLRDINDAGNRWSQTHLGRLAEDPLMKPAIDDIKKQIDARWKKNHIQASLDWVQVYHSVAGEVAVAVARNSAGGVGEICLMDIGQNKAAVQNELTKFEADLAKEKAKRTTQVVAGVTVVIHELPPAAGAAKPKKGPATPDYIVHFIKDDLFVFSSDLKLAVEVLGRIAGAKDTLSEDTVYVETMERCKREAGALVPNVRWFLRPIELALAARGPYSGDSIDYLEMLKKQGFAEAKGIGGFHNLLVTTDKGETFEVLYRTAFHKAGPLAGGARVLGFPNGPARGPEPWVPYDVATFISVNWELDTAFDAMGSIVDDVMQEPGYFNDLIKQIKEEEDGPRIDIRTDLIQQVGDRAEMTILSDFTLPLDAFSQRSLIAIKAKNPTALAENLAKGFKGDPSVKEREIEGIKVWEFHEQAAKKPVRPVKTPGKPQPPKPVTAKGPPAAVCVAHGFVMITNRVGFLEKVLKPGGRPLSGDFDYKRVDAQITKMSEGKPVSFRAFARTADDIQPTYEMFKAGKLRDDASPVGLLLRKGVGDDKLKDPIRGGLLPNFDVVRRQLSPVGWYVKTEDKGWTLSGFMLSKPADE